MQEDEEELALFSGAPSARAADAAADAAGDGTAAAGGMPRYGLALLDSLQGLGPVRDVVVWDQEAAAPASGADAGADALRCARAIPS